MEHFEISKLFSLKLYFVLYSSTSKQIQLNSEFIQEQTPSFQTSIEYRQKPLQKESICLIEEQSDILKLVNSKIAIMNQNAHTVLPFVLLIVLVSSTPNILLLDFSSNTSLAALSPLFNQNPNLESVVMNLTDNPTLDMNSQFVPLLNFILSNSTVYSQIFTNLCEITALKWTQPMPPESVRNLLITLMEGSLSLFYHMMIDTLYLNNEEQCQQFLQAVIDTNLTEPINNILAPITGQYFWNKRCVLSQTNLVSVAQKKTLILSIDQKLALVAVIRRMRVVHNVIFGIV